VLAPVDVKDCFYLTLQAFNLAEEYRCPVFIASNKEIGMTRESVDLEAVEKPDIIARRKPSPGRPFLPFQISNGQSVPYFLPIGDGVLVRQSSSTHGADGYITTDADEIAANQQRLLHKLQGGVDRFSFYEERAEAAGAFGILADPQNPLAGPGSVDSRKSASCRTGGGG
jgi:2-oxoglutarate ferredoxin oxidoreductase subunit alpha